MKVSSVNEPVESHESALIQSR